MRPFRFIHTADLHLDSQFGGVGSVPEQLQQRLVNSPLRALERIVDACLRCDVDCLIIAGDLYDSSRVGIRTLAYVRQQLLRLKERGIMVVVAAGNHDPLEARRIDVAWPEHVHWLPSREVGRVPVKRGGRVIASVYGISYGQKEVVQNLAVRFPDRPDGDSACSVAVLHSSVDGLGGRENYAPAGLQDLVEKGYCYWALGHVHQARILYNSLECSVVYSGSPQGLNSLETGFRGCWLVEAAPKGPITTEFVPVSDVVWEKIELPIEGIADQDNLNRKVSERLDQLARAYGGSGVLVEIELSGRGVLHPWLNQRGVKDELLQMWQEGESDFTGSFVFPHKLTLATRRDLDLSQLRSQEDFVADLLQLAEGAEPAMLERAAAALEPLMTHRRVRRYLKSADEDALKALLAEAKVLALDLLLGEDQ